MAARATAAQRQKQTKNEEEEACTNDVKIKRGGSVFKN